MNVRKFADFRAVIFTLFMFHATLFAQIPPAYYDAANGKTGEELKTALHGIISDGHRKLTYAQLWQAFQKTDERTSGAVWDMFSDCDFEFFTNQCGSGGFRNVCDCYARDHSFPRSWYGGREDVFMHTDLFHLYPIDGMINSQRGNRPLGEVGEENNIRDGGKGKLGPARAGLGFGGSGQVYEPDDEYKGDFARTYFYMVTRYEDEVEDWIENAGARFMLDGTAHPAFQQWALNMLLAWHENDPVSSKEIERNDAVFDLQGNRNPFIDVPEYVGVIWRNEPQIPPVSAKTPQSAIFTDRRKNVSVIITGKNLQIKNAKSAQAQIYCANGKLLKKFSGDSANLSQFPKGVYLLKFARGGGVKFVLR